MMSFTAISRERHGSLRWKQTQNMSFAAAENAVAIVGSELAKAVPSMPLAFLRQGGQSTLVAMLSLQKNRNLFVGPAGNWLAGYIPAAIRSYPFRLIKPVGGIEPVLCIDETHGLISDGQDGEPFFLTDGAISPALRSVLDLQIAYERNRKVTDSAVAALVDAGVIVPWAITVRTEQGEQMVEGLHRVDEAALGQLSNDAFSGLRAAGALPIAYGQLFSMNQLVHFQSLAAAQARLAPKPLEPFPSSLDHLFDRNDDIELKFD